MNTAFKCFAGHASFFACLAAAQRSGPNLHQSSSWWTSLFCFLPLLFEEFCAPRNTHRNCDSGKFFPLAPLSMKRSLWGETYLTIHILSICRKTYHNQVMSNYVSVIPLVMLVAEGTSWGITKPIWFNYLSYQMSGIGLPYRLRCTSMPCRFLHHWDGRFTVPVKHSPISALESISMEMITSLLLDIGPYLQALQTFLVCSVWHFANVSIAVVL